MEWCSTVLFCFYCFFLNEVYFFKDKCGTWQACLKAALFHPALEIFRETDKQSDLRGHGNLCWNCLNVIFNVKRVSTLMCHYQTPKQGSTDSWNRLYKEKWLHNLSCPWKEQFSCASVWEFVGVSSWRLITKKLNHFSLFNGWGCSLEYLELIIHVLFLNLNKL